MICEIFCLATFLAYSYPVELNCQDQLHTVQMSCLTGLVGSK